MLFKNFLIMVCYLCNLYADSFSIALIKEEETNNTERMILAKADKNEEFFLEKNRIISRKDLHQATVSIQNHSIIIELTDEGARTMTKATENMVKGKERIGIIIDGKLVSVVVVHGIIGKRSEITGIYGFDNTKLQNLVDLIMSDKDASASNGGKGNTGHDHKLTEEKSPILMDPPYGISLKNFVEKYGDPTQKMSDLHNGVTRLVYQLDRSKLLKLPNGSNMPDLIIAVFAEDKLITLKQDFSEEHKKQNLIMSLPSTLRIIVPNEKQMPINKGIALYIENIKIKNLNQKVNQRDIFDVLTILAIAEQACQENDKMKAIISSNCDIIIFLSKYFPEINKLATDSKDGNIKFSILNATVQEYLQGKKSIPTVEQ